MYPHITVNKQKERALLLEIIFKNSYIKKKPAEVSILYPLLRNLLKTPQIKNNVLFGSDFYMLQKDYSERRFGIDVRGYLNDDEFWMIAETNPKKFLGVGFNG